MEVFPITHFRVETEYPESSVAVQFGKSWTFTAPPDAPDQRGFTLHFTGMKYYVDGSGNLDTTTNAAVNNLRVLQLFYESHRLYEKFQFHHPVEGTLICTFAKPLIIPKGLPGGNGMVEDFTMKLLEHPGA